MIPTIRSRSMTIKFNKVQWGVLHQHLCKVADAEGVSYDPDALKIAARRSSGSVRNSLQNLQTLITFAGKEKITLDIANEALQYIDESKFFDLLDEGWKLHCAEAEKNGREPGEYFHIYALNRLMEAGKVIHAHVEGVRLDTGEPAGYLEAILRYADTQSSLKPVIDSFIANRS